MQWSSTSRLNGASSYWRNNTASYSQRLSRPPSLHQEENENVKKMKFYIFLKLRWTIYELIDLFLWFRYGPIFKTNVAGRPVIITADPEFNHFLLRQDGKLVDTWSMDTFAEVFDQASQSSRKYTRNLTLNHFGIEALRGRLLPQMEAMARKTLSSWASHDSVEVKSESVTVNLMIT